MRGHWLLGPLERRKKLKHMGYPEHLICGKDSATCSGYIREDELRVARTISVVQGYRECYPLKVIFSKGTLLVTRNPNTAQTVLGICLGDRGNRKARGTRSCYSLGERG